MAQIQTVAVKAIVNTTPLVALSTVGQLDLLNALFDQVIVPEGVYSETLAGGGKVGASELRQYRKSCYEPS